MLRAQWADCGGRWLMRTSRALWGLIVSLALIFLQGSSCSAPGPGTFTATGDLVAARGGHTATLLATGKVLIAGGEGVDMFTTAELYDPATGTFAATGSIERVAYFTRRRCCPAGRFSLQEGRARASSRLRSSTTQPRGPSRPQEA